MIRLAYDNRYAEADFSAGDGGTETGDELTTAVLVSLFCDRRAEPGDDVPEGVDARGWWAESFFDEPDAWGSKLWQVLGGKATSTALVTAREACEDALTWMVADGAADRVEVETWWIDARPGYMGILVTVYRPGVPTPQYVGPWEIYYGDS